MSFQGFSDTTGRTKIASSYVPASTMVIAALGQSNIAGSIDSNYTIQNPNAVDNFNIFDGSLYRAQEPLLGCHRGSALPAGIGGCWLTRFADKMIMRGACDRVILIPIGFPSFASWWDGGIAMPQLMGMFHRTGWAGIVPNHIFWMQGESDAQHGTQPGAYTAHVKNVCRSFRRANLTVPFYVSKTTRIGAGASPSIRAAQANCVDSELNIVAGPDTDVILDRHDGTHFNAAGGDFCAELWADVLSPN